MAIYPYRTRWCLLGRAKAVCAVMVLCVSGSGAQQTQPRPQISVTDIDQIERTTRQPSQRKENGSISLEADQTVEKILDAIAKQAQMRIVYGDRGLDLRQRAKVSLRNVSVANALAAAVRGTGLIASIAPDGETIVVRSARSADTTRRQDSVGTITGTLTDSSQGTPVRGSTVTVLSTGQRVVTDAMGRFTLRQVPIGTQQVEFRSLGFKTVVRTVEVTTRPSVLTVTIPQHSTVLAGVITTATGEQRKLEVGNSVVALNVDSIMNVAPISRITDLLEARVPGMTIQRTSGTPGDPSRIRLRGAGSINLNNDPIVIVDGIRQFNATSDSRNTHTVDGRTYATPSPLDQIDPNSVERIEVLRGPSAAALYGSDAANGVIIITTKRGQVRPRPTWQFAGTAGTNYMPYEWPVVWYKFVSRVTGGASEPCWGFCGDVSVDSLKPFQALNDDRSTALGRGSLYEGSMTVNGGSTATQYSITVTARNDLGVLRLPRYDAERYTALFLEPVPGWMERPDRLEQLSGNARFDVVLSPQATVILNSRLSRQVQRRTSMSASFESAIQELQYQYVDFSVYSPTPLLGNPFERVTSSNLMMQNSVTTNYSPFGPRMPLTMTVGFNTRLQNNQTQIDRDRGVGDLVNGAWSGSSKNTTDVTANIRTQVPLRDRLTLSLGANYNAETTNDQTGSFVGFNPGVTDPTEGNDPTKTAFRRAKREQRSAGWFLEPRLNVKSRFFVMPGFRLDNNGLSGKNAGFNGLPKINLSWIASDEPFFPLKNTFQMLRLRGAFGVAGVQPRLEWGSRLYNEISVHPFNATSAEYGEMMLLSTIGNTRLRPERGVELEGGVDLELLGGRLIVEATQYQNSRKDMIVTDQTAPSANGVSESYRVNLGDVKRTGTELMMSAQLIARRSVGVQWGVNMSRRTSRVERLTREGAAISAEGNRRYVVGYPMEAIWIQPIVGYTDLDGDGIISQYEVSISDSVQYVGTSEPRWEIGSHQNMTFLNGRIGLNASWSFQQGALQARGDGNNNVIGFRNADGPRGFAGVNAPHNSQATQAAWLAAAYGINIGAVQRVDILRLQSISLSYHIGDRLRQYLRIRSGQIAVQGYNLGLWTNYVGVDPNVNAFSTGERVMDGGNLPQPRMWQLRISIGY